MLAGTVATSSRKEAGAGKSASSAGTAWRPERLIGSIRREAQDHFLLFSEKQVRKITAAYVDYYNHFRPHQGIGKIPHGDRGGAAYLAGIAFRRRVAKGSD